MVEVRCSRCGKTYGRREVVAYREGKVVVCQYCLREIVQKWLDLGFETIERGLDIEVFGH